MNEKKLRELDAFIAEHVFKIRVIKKKFSNHKNSWGYKLSDGKNEWPNANGLHGWGWSHDEDGARFHTPRYTTDPAADMMVLEKCACETTNIEIDFRDGDKFGVGTYRRTVGIKEAEADTLPLAICLFAKQLFHAQEKETKVQSR